MRFSRVGLAALAVSAILVTGCATGSGGSYSSRDQMANTVYATHRMVRNLEQNLGGSVDKLNQTAASLEMRVDQNEQQNLRLQAMVEENQVKLDRLQAKLDEFTTAVYRAMNVTPPASGGAGSGARMSVPPSEIQISPSPAAVTPPPQSMSPGFAPSTAPDVVSMETETPPAFEASDAMTDYQDAQKLFVDRNYQAAFVAYDNYLQRYPNSSHAANAQFWKAQSLLRLERDQEAIGEYVKLRQNYPNSDKIAPSYYYEALSYVRLGQTQRAISALETVIRQYPATAAATQAEELLSKLRQ